MTTIVTRTGKGSILTIAEMDANLNNLNNNKLETSTVGVSVQAYSANLDEFATVNPTVAGLALLDDADAAAQRATLGLVIGTNVQAYDADIPTVAASQAEMEAGTEIALRSMSPLRVAQAISALTTSSGITLGTPVATTSGSTIDFTGIPSTVKQIIVTLKGVSTNGTTGFGLQIGDSGGVETSGYSGGVSDRTADSAWSTFCVLFALPISLFDTYSGQIILTLENSSTNSWSIFGNIADTSTGMTNRFAGHKSLTATLDRVRLMNATFDAGEMNIAYM
jgi:hypothetical protein